GAPGVPRDVAVRDGLIVEPAEASAGARIVEAGDLALAPGFIDVHSHADHTLPAFPSAPNSISQGVTTELVGLCGFSPAPVSPVSERAEQLHDLARGVGPDLDWRWSDFASFLDRLDAAHPPTNVAALVGHSVPPIAAMCVDQ